MIEAHEIEIIRVVIDFFPKKGGGSTHINELLINLAPSVFNQILIAPQYLNSQKFDKESKIKIFRIKQEENNRIPGSSLVNIFLYSWRSVKCIDKIYNKNKNQIIYVHHFDIGVVISFLLKIYKLNVPLIVMHHGSPVEKGYSGVKVSFTKLYRKILIKMFPPDHYIQLNDGQVDTNFLTSLSNNGLEYSIVNHGIDTNYYLPININNHNEFVVLSNHMLNIFKRVDLAINAFNIFLKNTNFPNAKLIVLGSGPMKEQLLDIVNLLKINQYVHFTGEVDIEEVRYYIQNADLVLGTSLISNLNRSILESMACGIPSIVFKCDGDDKLFNNGNNIILVPKGDIDEMGKQISEAWKDGNKFRAIGMNGRRSIILNRSWAARINQEIQICEKVINNHIRNNK
ncbi:MAG: glycosyltransferase family 4 protein [Methanomassiliicoccales archaeon]